uniref:homeobox protein Hox-C6-like n=1 Tax=Styela clava TaxID=7725 RepID=UPI0019396986|nr:homeobox protein Hox-C6-like [Styela clava]
MISYRHPYLAVSNAQWTPFLRLNYAGSPDSEDIITKKRKFSSDENSGFKKVTIVNQETQDTKILDTSESPEQVAKFNNRQRKAKTLFTIDALLGHSNESPSKKRKLELTQSTKTKNDSFDSGFASSEENDESIIACTDANDSGICVSESREEYGQIHSVPTDLPQPKVRNNRQLPHPEYYSRIYIPINDVYYLYSGLNKIVQQNWMNHSQHAISYAPIETTAFVGQGNTQSKMYSHLSKHRPQRTEKAKRTRTTFTQKQLERLETEFNNQQYMVGIERRILAKNLRLTDAQVKVWFQNRRIRYRNEKKREPQEEENNKLDIHKREAIGKC